MPRTNPPPPREAHRGTAGYPRKDVAIDAPRLNRPTITEPWVRMLAPREKQLEGPGSQASVGTGNVQPARRSQRTAAVPATAVECAAVRWERALGAPVLAGLRLPSHTGSLCRARSRSVRATLAADGCRRALRAADKVQPRCSASI